MISFVNTFLSYVLLMVVILVVAGVAVAIGITMRKKKDASMLVEQAEGTQDE